MKSRFGSQAGAEALFNEVSTQTSLEEMFQVNDTGSLNAQAGTNANNTKR